MGMVWESPLNELFFHVVLPGCRLKRPCVFFLEKKSFNDMLPKLVVSFFFGTFRPDCFGEMGTPILTKIFFSKWVAPSPLTVDFYF